MSKPILDSFTFYRNERKKAVRAILETGRFTARECFNMLRDANPHMFLTRTEYKNYYSQKNF